MITRKFLIYLLVALLIGACSSQTDSDFVGQAKDYIDKGEIRQASIQLKNALQQNPDNAEARWLMGKVHMETGNSAGAEKELRRALDLGVSEQAIRPLLAQSLAKQGKNKDALALSTEGLSPAPQAEILAIQATILLVQGELEQAENKITQALLLQPNSAAAITEQARLTVAQGKSNDASALLDELLKQNANYAPAWRLLADIKRHEQKPTEAEIALSNAIKHQFDNTADRLNRALVRIELQKYDQAQADIDLLMRVIPNYYELHYAQGLLHFRQQRFSQAEASLQRAYQGNNNFLPTLFYLGATHFQLKQFEQAELLTSRFFSANPGFIPGRKLLAKIRLQEDSFADAESLLRPIINDNNKDIETLNLLALALIKQGITEEGIALLKQVVALQPESGEALLRLGSALLTQGNEGAGLQALETASNLDPELLEATNKLITRHYIKTKKYDKALASATAYQQHNPDISTPYNLLGLAQLGKGDIKTARTHFDKASQISPGDITANQKLASIALRDQDYPTARQHYNTVLANQPDHLDTLMKLSILDELENRQTDMVKHLEQAVAAHPKAVQPRTSLARHYLAKSEPEKVAVMLGDLQQSHYDHPEVLHVLGQAQLAQRNTTGALTTFNRLIELQPKSAQAHFLLGLAHAQLNDAKTLKAELDKTIKLNSDHFGARLALTRLALLNQDPGAAQKHLAILKTKAPDNPDVKFLEGQLAQTRGQQEKALDIYTALFENNSNTTNMLALIQQKWDMQNHDGAIATLKQWLTEHTDDVAARLRLASAYTKIRQDNAAIQQYKTVLKQAPNNLLALNNLAWQLKDTDTKKALVYAEKANSLAPDSVVFQDTLAVVLMKNGQHQRALRISKSLTKKHANNPTFAYHQAMILQGAGNNSEAEELLSGLLKRGGTFSERSEAEQMLMQLQNK